MRIRRVFDVKGPMGFVPNGINWNFTNIFWKYNFYVNHKLIDEFNETYGQIGVYDCNLNLSEDVTKSYHINFLHYDHKTNIVDGTIKIKLFLHYSSFWKYKCIKWF